MQEWIYEKYGEEDNFDFYCINIGENANLVEEYVEELGIEIPVLMGSNAFFSEYRLRGGVSPFPVDYIIGGDRIVRYAMHEYEPEIMEMTIDRLLEIQDAPYAKDKSNIIPATIILDPAYPNPFNSMVNIPFSLNERSNVALTILNLNGQVINTMSNSLGRGEHRFLWNATGMPSGIYLYSINNTSLQKLVLMR